MKELETLPINVTYGQRGEKITVGRGRKEPFWFGYIK